jgi:hypothetical protein
MHLKLTAIIRLNLRSVKKQINLGIGLNIIWRYIPVVKFIFPISDLVSPDSLAKMKKSPTPSGGRHIKVDLMALRFPISAYLSLKYIMLTLKEIVNGKHG